MTASPRPSHRSPTSHTSARRVTAAQQGWPITPTPVSVWLTGSLRSSPNSLHQPDFGEPPCAWTWPTLLWETITTSYAHPDGRVAVTDPADDILLQATLARTRRMRTLLAGQEAPAGSRARTRGPVDLLIIPPPCLHLDHELGDEAITAQPGHDRVLEKQLLALTGHVERVRHGGVIAALTRITPDPGGATDRIGPLIEQAHALGLTYLQHHPVIHALVREGRIGPTSSPDKPSGSNGAHSLLHRSVYSDLIVLHRPAVTDDQPGGAL